MKNIAFAASDEDFDKSLPGFLREHKLPTDEDGQPTKTAIQHVQDEMIAWYNREWMNGARKIAGCTTDDNGKNKGRSPRCFR